MSRGSLRARLVGLCGSAVFAFTVLLGAYGYRAWWAGQADQRINARFLQAWQDLRELNDSIKEIRFNLVEVLHGQQPAAEARERLNAAMPRIASLWERFERNAPVADPERPLVASLREGMDLLNKVSAQLDAAYEANDKNSLEAILRDAWPTLQASLLKPSERLLPSLAQRYMTEREAIRSHQRGWLIGVAVTALLVGVLVLGLALALESQVRRALTRIRDGLTRMAAGDLAVRLPESGLSESSEIGAAFNASLSAFANVISEVIESARATHLASDEIARGNLELSARTEEQAASLQQTSSSLEEMTSVVRQNSENSRQANVLASEASGIAVRGGEMAKMFAETMDSIAASSSRISQIIGVIDGIAFQTNLLALNAGVEAARAGETGRGFAVVAAEVRNLAQRSTVAAKEIKTLIADSAARVHTGSQLVKEASKTMSEIETAVDSVTEIIASITAASLEQGHGIEQMNQAMTQIDQGTQQNAALVEQAAAAAESLRQQSQRLMQAIAQFRLAEKGSRGDHAAPLGAGSPVVRPAIEFAGRLGANGT